MALETREKFLEEWKKVSEGLFGPDTDEEAKEQAGNELYDARVLAYNVAEEGLDLTAHRYFHGMASVNLNFMLQLPVGELLPFLTGEYMFHEGFIAGVNYGRNGEGDGTGMGDEQAAMGCIDERDNLIRTRGEIEKTFMPAAILAILELQKMVRAAPPLPVGGEEGEGSPIIPPDGGRGYF